ncbi:hypothetical protein ED312_14295 [Sinomicrobium pectinilyticum]|uniref:Uncharacterized protein n=1 Tax=Sinomicrobium pectinilyticum TaxID=1084421 RepID=A0A3N0E8J4_SINP1|nr:hypothetical protein ED312_14295 [Sinomicrobium pectinilyticum]
MTLYNFISGYTGFSLFIKAGKMGITILCLTVIHIKNNRSYSYYVTNQRLFIAIASGRFRFLIT